MAELNTTKINGNISATGTVSGTNITTMQNEINELNDNLETVINNVTSLQSKLNSAWINLDTTSIFEFFPYNNRTGIWTLFNGADLPSEVAEHSSTPWYMVLKAHERMILFHDTGFYFTGASSGTWSKVWTKM